VSETNLEQFREVTPEGRFTLQNSAMLKVRLENDQIQAKLGSMVAYQGDVRFEHKSGGLGRFFKKAVTGEGVKLMAANGTGDLFLAQDKRKIMVLDLQNERMTVNGDNILAFEPGIDWDIKRVEGAGRLAGGLFNVVLDGTGKVALTSDGEPVLLDTSTPTFADPESAIAWSGGVRTGVRSDVSFKTFTGRGSGESFQISFEGAGWVLIQSIPTLAKAVEAAVSGLSSRTSRPHRNCRRRSLVVRSIRSAFHALAEFLCTVRRTSVIMCT
jgi:uncharacterized protein (AIM24 family)